MLSALFAILFLAGNPPPQTGSTLTPIDPVLSLRYAPLQIAFEKASPSIIAACRDERYQVAWILARTSRPQGEYILLTGYVWVDQDTELPSEPELENDGNGGIYLLHPNGSCEGLWDPDNAFGDFFPDAPNDKPTPQDASIIHDLGLDMLSRDERAFGGRQGLIKALNATGPDTQQDPAMQPLLAALRKPAVGAPAPAPP